MLTDLQVRVRHIVGQLPESEQFALSGGAALVVSGIVHRPTNDLDFFAAYPHQVGELLDAAQAALEGADMEVTRIAEGPTFARLRVSSGGDTTYLDLASDYRLKAPVATDEGFVLAEDELAADKVLALTDRAEVLDFVDFERLAARYDIDSLCELAASKDGGFRREHLAGALAHFDKITPTMFDAYTDDYEALRHHIATARNSLQASAREGPSLSNWL